MVTISSIAATELSAREKCLFSGNRPAHSYDILKEISLSVSIYYPNDRY